MTAKEYLQQVRNVDRLINCLQIVKGQMLDDAASVQGISYGDKVWVFGKEHSQGMTAEIVEAKRLNKPLRFYGEEVCV